MKKMIPLLSVVCIFIFGTIHIQAQSLSNEPPLRHKLEEQYKNI